jgi:uncharacterized protein
MLPVFPDLKKIELSDKELIEEFTKDFPPFNDFEFVSLWTYNIDGSNSISTLNNNFVIRIHDFITGKHFYTFIGTNKVGETAEILIQKSIEEGLNPTLKLIPEVNISSEPVNNLLVAEDPDNHEYILSVDEIAALEGGKFHDKRNLVNRFKRDNQGVQAKILDLRDNQTKEEVRTLFSLWAEQKEKDADEVAIELSAIEKLFGVAELGYLISIGVYVDGKLVGFSTCHPVQQDFVILSFEKGDISFRGIYEFINNELAKHLKELGFKYINYEQDLGIPGLRRSKMLWRPVSFLKKYIISKNT